MLRVTLADDNQPLRESLAELVANTHGMSVVGLAEDATAAIELARVSQPDVAVIGMGMPGGGGGTAAAGVHAASPGTRILVLSTQRDEGSVIGMLRAGASGYLLDGTAPAAIVMAIEEMALGRAVLSPELGQHVLRFLSIQKMPPRPASAHLVRVMVAEDDPAVLESTADVIRYSAGFELAGTATTVADAIGLACTTHPDVALIDSGMPDWGGEHIALQIGRMSPLTRVVVFSVKDRPDELLGILRGATIGQIVRRGTLSRPGDGGDESAQGYVVLQVADHVLRDAVAAALGPER
jgi:DNA-binding NarL/FixJ family response regulator